jgi:hypothetical protein
MPETWTRGDTVELVIDGVSVLTATVTECFWGKYYSVSKYPNLALTLDAWEPLGWRRVTLNSWQVGTEVKLLIDGKVAKFDTVTGWTSVGALCMSSCPELYLTEREWKLLGWRKICKVGDTVTNQYGQTFKVEYVYPNGWIRISNQPAAVNPDLYTCD